MTNIVSLSEEASKGRPKEERQRFRENGGPWRRRRDLIEEGTHCAAIIDEYIRHGILPSRKVGRARVIRQDDWDALNRGEFAAKIEAFRAAKRTQVAMDRSK